LLLGAEASSKERLACVARRDWHVIPQEKERTYADVRDEDDRRFVDFVGASVVVDNPPKEQAEL
jgi:hypothetical protein